MKKFKKAFVGGTFDLFHVGHQFFLMQASNMAEEIVIVVARDTTVQRIKKRLPKHTELQRFQRIEEENILNSSVRLGRGDGDFLETLREEAPDVLLLGYDQKIDEELFREKFPELTIIRAEEYHPSFFKSSKFQKYNFVKEK